MFASTEPSELCRYFKYVTKAEPVPAELSESFKRVPEFWNKALKQIDDEPKIREHFADKDLVGILVFVAELKSQVESNEGDLGKKVELLSVLIPSKAQLVPEFAELIKASVIGILKAHANDSSLYVLDTQEKPQALKLKTFIVEALKTYIKELKPKEVRKALELLITKNIFDCFSEVREFVVAICQISESCKISPLKQKELAFALLRSEKVSETVT